MPENARPGWRAKAPDRRVEEGAVAGPAGAATALLLARSGVGVTLVEREGSFERVFRGEGIMPLGMDALIQMGIGEALGFVPQRLVDSWSIWIDGEEVFVISEPKQDLGERAMRVVSQPALLELMVEQAGRYPSFSFERGARVHGLIRDETGRVVGAELEENGAAREAMSPVRAQGINLALRDAIVAANHLVPMLANGAGPDALDAACRAVQAEREPEIVRAQKLQKREAAGQGNARSGSWRFELTKRLARRMGRYRWAQNAWLKRQHDLRFGSTSVKLRVSL